MCPFCKRHPEFEVTVRYNRSHAGVEALARMRWAGREWAVADLLDRKEELQEFIDSACKGALLFLERQFWAEVNRLMSRAARQAVGTADEANAWLRGESVTLTQPDDGHS